MFTHMIGTRKVSLVARHADGRFWVRDEDGDNFVVRPYRLKPIN